jgi:hypothetical protein
MFKLDLSVKTLDPKNSIKTCFFIFSIRLDSRSSTRNKKTTWKHFWSVLSHFWYLYSIFLWFDPTELELRASFSLKSIESISLFEWVDSSIQSNRIQNKLKKIQNISFSFSFIHVYGLILNYFELWRMKMNYWTFTYTKITARSNFSSKFCKGFQINYVQNWLIRIERTILI